MSDGPKDPFDPLLDHAGVEHLPPGAHEALRDARMGWHDYFALVDAASFLEMLAGANALNTEQLRAALIAAALAEHQDDDDPWWQAPPPPMPSPGV